MNQQEQNRFDPERYIKTKSSSVLAFVKMLEAIAAGAGIILLVFVSEKISQYTQLLQGYLTQSAYFVFPESFARALTNLLKFPMAIPVIILLLIVLDGIGVLMMRYGSSGEGLVRFVHFVHWIVRILEIICLIVGFVRFVLNLNHVTQSVGDNRSLSFSIGAMGAFVYIYFFAVLGLLLFECNYHHDIRVVLKTVHSERRSGQIQKVGRNHLAGRCTWFVWGTGLWMLAAAFCFIYPIVSHKEILPYSTWENLPDILGPMAWLGINFVLTLLAFLKYLSLRICVGKFNKCH